MESWNNREVRRVFVAFYLGVALCCSISLAGSGVGTIGDPNGLAGQSSLEQRLNKKISVEFRKTAIEDVLRIMADQADVDIVKSPKVTGEVTVTLTDVPLEEALNNILTVHGFAYVLSQNMIRVVTSEEMAEKPEILQTKTFEIVYADVAEVVKALEKFKSAKGSVSYIQGTSHVIVTDTETKIRDITAFIEKVDQMTPQILVEARIYDISSTERFDRGIQWQVGRNTTFPGGITSIGTNPSGDRRPFTTGVFEGGVTKSKNAVGALRWGWITGGLDVDALLRLQHEDINAKLLANPRILVLDNEQASIKIISEIPYQELTESAMGGSVGTTAFREVGVELLVTPHVAVQDEMIRLHLQPKFSIRKEDVDVAGIGVTYKQPVVDKREADTKLLVKNGQTVVLGGLRKKEVTQQTNKVPVLGDIPGVGKLFRFKGEDTVISELVVFITPWIVEQPVLTEDMTDDEKEAYEATKFKGPKLSLTEAEKKVEVE